MEEEGERGTLPLAITVCGILAVELMVLVGKSFAAVSFAKTINTNKYTKNPQKCNKLNFGHRRCDIESISFPRDIMFLVTGEGGTGTKERSTK